MAPTPAASNATPRTPASAPGGAPMPLLEYLAAAGVQVQLQPANSLAPAQLIALEAAHWGALARVASAGGWRWVAAWGEDMGVDADGSGSIRVYACFELAGAYVIARTEVPRAGPVLASHTPCYPNADRPERHIRDLLGVAFADHPDPRRWTRHQAWPEAAFPLRCDFPAAGQPLAQTAGDLHYAFLLAQGSGVYEIPVGPVHAGIIEPGHFRFQAVGETVLRLEERLGYTHKGIEKIAVGRDADGLARLAARVSGDCTVAHGWAACMAMESAAGVQPPPRAQWLRALMCERERVANHLGDLGGMLNDIAFAFGSYQFARLREAWQRVSRQVFGHRFMMDRVVAGGVAVDIDAERVALMRDEAGALRRQMVKLMTVINDLPSVADRVRGAGMLKPEFASALGCVGFVGRASGVAFDLRRDAPYAPYDQLAVKVPLHHRGDVNARARMRVEEIAAALDLIDALLGGLPGGAIRAGWVAPAAQATGLGLVESWRGEILCFVRFGADARVARYFPRDPSWLNWPALELLIADNIVPDFPVCNKSVNASYSGHDL